MDELDLQNLGGLPELRFLNLDLLEGCSAAVSCNVNDSSVVYFPKLRCFKLYGATVLFLASKEDNKVSFHLWDGQSDIAVPFDSDNYELQRSIPPSGVVSDDENEDDSIIVKGGAAAL